MQHKEKNTTALFSTAPLKMTSETVGLDINMTGQYLWKSEYGFLFILPAMLLCATHNTF